MKNSNPKTKTENIQNEKSKLKHELAFRKCRSYIINKATKYLMATNAEQICKL